jgi:hypothetical protein
MEYKIIRKKGRVAKILCLGAGPEVPKLARTEKEVENWI